jgi:hypothetical protein
MHLLKDIRNPGQAKAHKTELNLVKSKIIIIASKGIFPIKINNECKFSSL